MPIRYFDITKPHDKLLYEHSDEYFVGEIISNEQGQPVDFLILEVNLSFLKKRQLTYAEVEGKTYCQLFGQYNPRFIQLCHGAALWQESMEEQLFFPELSLQAKAHVSGFTSNRFAVMLTDVSLFEKADKDLKLVNEKFLNATEMAGMAIWEFDLVNMKLTYTNDRWYEMFGIDNKDNIGPELVSNIPAEDYERLAENLKFVMNAENHSKTTEYDYRYQHPKTGKWHWFKNKEYIIHDETGKRTVGFGIDITAEKELLTQAQQEKQFFEAISTKSIAAFFIWDTRDEKFQFLNNEFTNLLGYTQEDMNAIGRLETRKTIVKSEYHLALEKAMEEVKNGANRVPLEYELKHKDGHFVFCYAIYSPFEYHTDGSVKSVIGSLIDISEIKRQEERVHQANLQKDRFLSNMSHEIRTPLNAVLGFSRLLRNPKYSDKQQKSFLDQIEQNSNQLLMLINDILDISKIESGNLSMTFDSCDFQHCMEGLHDSYAQKIRDMGLNNRLAVQLKSPLPPHQIRDFSTDILRMKQVLMNLMDNAIKFTENGKIEFGYELQDDNHVKIFVKDSGNGIPEEDLERIFERFAQSDQGKNQAIKGTGLGLAISRGIVTQLGGQIWAETCEEGGSCFQIVMPLRSTNEVNPVQKCDISQMDTQLSDKPRTKKVLVVDDNDSVLFYYQSVLEDFGIDPIIAKNGKIAVDIYKEHMDFDLILMDINMPVMDGPTAMRAIKSINPQAMVVAQSAFAMNEETRKYMEMGFNDYITKPVSEETLKKILE